MKKTLTLFSAFLFFFLPSQFCFAQNLVPNPSFEDTVACPYATDQVNLAQGWYHVSQTPDYFNSCTSVMQVSVPSNALGYQSAHSGNAYCGMFCYYPSSYREYIGAQLTTPLVIGQQYFVSFYLSLSGGLGYTKGCNKFGCKLSTVPFIYNSLIPDNNAMFHSDSIVADTVNWIFIIGSFIADSAYNYIALGNFFDNSQTDTLGMGPNSLYSYYYIDGICLSTDSLFCTGEIIKDVNALEKEIDFKISPNPCSTFFSIYSKEKITSMKLFNLLGEEILIDSNSIPASSKREINISHYKKGIYFLQLVMDKKLYSKKIIIQ